MGKIEVNNKLVEDGLKEYCKLWCDREEMRRPCPMLGKIFPLNAEDELVADTEPWKDYCYAKKAKLEKEILVLLQTNPWRSDQQINDRLVLLEEWYDDWLAAACNKFFAYLFYAGYKDGLETCNPNKKITNMLLCFLDAHEVK